MSIQDKMNLPYSNDNSFLRAMIIGEKGVGKTTLLKNCPKPIYLYCLDPDGEQSLLEDGQCPDWLVIDNRFQGNMGPDYLNFQQDVLAKLKNKTFEQFGTVCVDSLTTLSDSLIELIADEKFGKAKDNEVRTCKFGFDEWGILKSNLRFIIKKLLTVPCHFILTGHIQKDKDELSGAMINTIMCPGSSSQAAPTWFSEVWYMLSRKNKETKAIERILLTVNEGKYQAGTRLQNIAPEEPANIRDILKKANRPHEDKEY